MTVGQIKKKIQVLSKWARIFHLSENGNPTLPKKDVAVSVAVDTPNVLRAPHAPLANHQ
jgi:hypothetical protein